MSGNLGRRIAFAVVAIPAVLGVLYVGGWALVALLAALGMLGTWEVFGLARKQGVYPLVGLGLLAAVALPVVEYGLFTPWEQRATCFACPPPGMVAVWGGVWLMAVLGAALRTRAPTDRPLAAIAVTVFGPLYASGLLGFVLFLRHAQGAPTKSWSALWVAALPLILTWICDTAAMAAGRAFGGKRLAPVVSPNKTWAGAVAGALAAVVAAVAYEPLVLARFNSPFTIWQLALVGLVVGTIGQVGDVVESLLKREVGEKDSSTLIPGHGGVLDRLDSLYFVVPATAAVYAWFALA